MYDYQRLLEQLNVDRRGKVAIRLIQSHPAGIRTRGSWVGSKNASIMKLSCGDQVGLAPLNLIC